MLVADLVRRRAWLLVVGLAVPACTSNSEPAELPAKLQAPQLRTPMSNAYVGSIMMPGSLLPTFSWAPVDGAERPVSYELQISTDVSFARSLITIPTTSTSLKPAIELPVSRKVPVGARYYWRVRACDDVTCSEDSPQRVLNLGRSDHDYNGDGIADVIVGAPTYGSDALAHAYLYFGGGGATFNADPDGTLVAAAANDFFATSVASAGDVNADGFADVIVGAEAADGVGAAYVYYGGPGSAFEATPDLVVHGNAPGDRFGSSVAGAGDLNRDGFADFVVGAPGVDSKHGAVYAYLGGRTATPAPVTLLGSALTDPNEMYFGLEVAAMGDVDGDGYADLAVVVNSPTTNARVYFGANTAPLADSVPIRSGRVGRIAGANDVNGDGFADVIVGGSGDPAGGNAQLYFGGPTRTNLTTLRATYSEADPGFGGTVASPGDVDGDGYADLLIGVDERYQGSVGGVYLYFGGPQTGFGTFAYSTLIPSSKTSSIWLGASSGDVTGDGLADLVVGGIRTPNGNPSAPSVVIYAGGGRHAFDAPACGTLTDRTTSPSAGFGQAVASRAPRTGASGRLARVAPRPWTLKSRCSWLPTGA